MMALIRSGIIVIVICSGMFRVVLLAQPSRIVFSHYGVEDGLTSRTTRNIVKTSDNFLWITTDDGLCRFDSERFYFFRHQPGDSTSISANACDQMVRDPHDHLWIVAGAFLDVFDPMTGVFTHCYIEEKGQREYRVAPEALCYDSLRHRVWVGTSVGLYYATPGSPMLQPAELDDHHPQFSKRVFNAMAVDREGVIWLGNCAGLFWYNPDSGAFQSTAYSVSKAMNGTGGVSTILIDQQDDIWLGTWMKGLVLYDQERNQAEHFYYADTSRYGNAVMHLSQSGFEGQENVLWLSATHFGFTAFNTTSKSFISYRTDFDNDKYGINGVVNGLLMTDTEGMWIAAEDGLHRYDPASQVFDVIDLARDVPQLSVAYPIEYITFDRTNVGKDSIIWFHVPYLGAYTCDLHTRKLAPCPSVLAHDFDTEVYAMYIDAANVLWISNKRSGLVGYDLNSQKRVVPPSHPFRGEWKWIKYFYEDRHQRLWMATYDGVFVFDKSRSEIRRISSIDEQLEAGSHSQSINGLAEDTNGNIWFATAKSNSLASALGFYNPDTKSARILPVGLINGYRMADRLHFFDMVCYKDSVFVSTDLGILTFSLASTGTGMALISTESGLINQRVHAMGISRDGVLWCSTVFGVSGYDLERKSFVNHTYISSALGRTKLPALSVSPNTGRVYIGQQGFLNIGSRHDDGAENEAYDTRFTSFRVADRTYFTEGAGIPNASVIRLTYKDNPVTIDFAMPGFRNAESNRYQYRLIGLSPEWTSTHLNSVTYANLAPGRYLFQVIGSGYDGQQSERPAELFLQIAPPWYKTWWFIAVLVLLVLGIAFGIIRLKFNALREQFALKNKIAGDLHDEIGSTLTSIHILSNVSQQALESSPDQARTMLGQISAQSKSVQQNMSDIVWAIRPENERIENLVARIREYVSQTLDPLHIRHDITMEAALVSQSLSLTARKELLLIAKEAIHNIVRHSGADIVSITLAQKGNRLHFAVFDNGTWKAEGGTTGTGRRSMQRRAELLGGTLHYDITSQGTQLKVEFPIT